MRPVNLIPPEERRGEKAPLRTGPVAYLLVGVLAVALLMVTAVVLTGNQVKDRQAELEVLELREANAKVAADALGPYAEFASMSDARDATVTSLAQSRFDWERVLRELSLVIPNDVWLVNATGSVASGAAGGSASAANSLREDVSGPALELVGCAAGQQAVAGFATALEDIDGVTRVGVSSSQLGEGAGGESASAGVSDCRTRAFISGFEIVAAFDEVPVPATATAPAPLAPSTTVADPADAETAGTVSEQQHATGSAATQSQRADDAADLVPGASP